VSSKHLGILVSCEVDSEDPQNKEMIQLEAYLTGTGGGKYTQVYKDGKYYATRKTSITPVKRYNQGQ
jgi:hypothetical protein